MSPGFVFATCNSAMMRTLESIRLPRRVLASALLASALIVGALPATAAETDRTIVVVMIDGFPGRLLSMADTPNFERLLLQGAWTDRLIPAFPSLSHTNWASITTGCWPQRHGIVSNAFLVDRETRTRDEILDADTLLDCVPIHEVAESQGVRAAALGWTSSQSRSRGELASIVMPYFDYPAIETDLDRANQIGELLALPDAERPRLVLAYFSGPDHLEHHNGIMSKQVVKAVEHTDRALGALLGYLDAFAKTKPVTLLVATDHGMLDIHGLLNVEKILEDAQVEARWIADGPLAFVYLEDESTRAVAMSALAQHPHLVVVSPDAQPAHWRLGRSERLGDFMLYAKPGWFFPMDKDMPGWLPAYTRWWPAALELPAWIRTIGMHGYAIEDAPEMAGIFIAWGSGIEKKGELSREVRAIDLHPTLARLLWIRPGTPLDGRVLEELFSDRE